MSTPATHPVPRGCTRATSTRWTAHAFLLAVVSIIGGCGDPPPALEIIRAAGELRIATLNAGTTYYHGPHGAAGFEHDLARAFADWLGVEARFLVAADVRELRALVRSNKAHIGAALLPVTPRQAPGLAWGPSYAVSRQLVVCRRGTPRPRTADDLRTRHGAAVDGLGAAAVLTALLPPQEGHHWQLLADASVEDLLQQVDSGALDYAVVPSFDFNAARDYFPELYRAFALGDPQAVAWLYRPGPHDSLGRAQRAFLGAMRDSGAFAAIRDRYFARPRGFDYVASRAFMRHYAERLPAFRAHFEEVAAAHGFDWRLLAAMSYQESQWQADARSPTGVRGLMMLTRRTARQLGVDRLDPRDSIDGGARYLARLKARLPERLNEPDRTWLALAAYNVGFAHLEDARVLTERAGDDPDRWAEVRNWLPRLANRKWAKQVRHGYARGYQAVHFVRSVRRYYDVLRWLERDGDASPAPRPPQPAPLVSPVF